ncbi:MAG: AAA family ATPase, partial [Planctomycetes bacterium]|nr:AAA family ATPase [Planctomycetota bacterium]
MKLIRLSIEDWRGFRGGPWSIDFDPRVTLVHGENEAGKSTLFEAIRWALFERAKKSSREVPKIVPFDRPGAEPTVRLAFEHGGECWTIEKRFGKKGTALLSRQLANGQREELARHDEATERVVERIGAQLRKSGESKPSDWGVLRWLFMPQEPTARLLPDAKSDAVNSLGLERAAGTSKTFERIASRVATALDRHYTASGAYKSTSEIKIAEDNIADFERAIQRLRDELSESDDLRAQYDALREELPLIEAELAVARREWEVVQSETRDFDVQVEGRNTDEERRLRLEQELKSCEALVARREALDRRVKDAAARVEAARQKDTEHRYLAQRAQVSLEAARHEQDAARRGDKLARDTLEAARRNREEGRVAAELERLDAIIERARGLDTEIRSAAAAMGTTAPTAKDVQRAEALSLDLARHEAALSAVQLHVKVDDPELEVLVDGQEIESPEASADDLVEVRRRGQTKGVRIAGDSERAKARRQVADRTRDELESLLRSHGTESTTGLRRLAHAGEMRAATLVEKRSAREALD